MTSYRVAPWLTAEHDPLTEAALLQAITPKRACGECLKCCKLVPVVELKKGANEWCQHARLPGSQGGHGCKIYADRPPSCRRWSCLWLLDDSFAEELRPDRSHVVFDMTTDRVRAVQADGHMQVIEVVQAWCDPTRRDAHRAPAVREMIAMIAENAGMPTLVRFDERDGLVIVAPCFNKDGKWMEIGGVCTGTVEETPTPLVSYSAP